MPLTIRAEGDSVFVGLELTREQLAGLTKAQAIALARETVVEEFGWPRLVDLLPLIGATRQTRIAHVGQFIRAVLVRDKGAATTALENMVLDTTITAVEAQAIVGAFHE